MAQKTSKKTTKKKASTASKSRSKATRSAASKKKTARTTKKKAAKTVRAKKVTSTARKKTASKSTKKTTRRTTKKKTSPAKSGRPKTPRTTTTTKATRASKAIPASTTTTESSRRAARKLTPAEMEEFRHILLQKRAEILGDMSTLQSEALRSNRQDASGDLSSMPIHMADLGSDNYEMEFTLGLIEGERAILKEIDEALERVNEGTFGTCVATGQPVGKARLRAKPWAKYCYEYTLAQERGQAHGD